MAMRFNVPAVVATTVRRPDDTHYVYISDNLKFTDTGDFERDLITNVGMVNNLIGQTIMRFPEQWVWMHRWWKTSPPHPAGSEGAIADE